MGLGNLHHWSITSISSTTTNQQLVLFFSISITTTTTTTTNTSSITNGTTRNYKYKWNRMTKTYYNKLRKTIILIRYEILNH